MSTENEQGIQNARTRPYISIKVSHHESGDGDLVGVTAECNPKNTKKESNETKMSLGLVRPAENGASHIYVLGCVFNVTLHFRVLCAWSL